MVYVPAPIANAGEEVIVYNYRKRGKSEGTWEHGKISSLAYGNSFGRWSWKYTVMLGRYSGTNRPMFLYVGDDRIKKI